MPPHRRTRVRAALPAGLVFTATFAAALFTTAARPAPAHAEFRCSSLRYVFQTDCFEPPCTKPKRKLGDRLDLGPQIAVWVEAADRSRFVDTLMVTNLTARFGIGNRPGLMDLPSGPKHPYGKRLMALPIWAFARGKMYPQIVMQDDHEEWMGFHESSSSPDPYFCRPMGLAEVDVDAISCPTKVFNSAKGKMDNTRPQVPYPPRNDLTVFTDKDCNVIGGGCQGKSAEMYSTLNDLDAVAAPTPAFDNAFEGRWTIPTTVSPSDPLVLAIEVSREFDQNASHTYPSYKDTKLSGSGFTQTGLPNNLGQPSVVFRVPFKIDGQSRFESVPAYAGYGSVTGADGVIVPPDATISDAPGSGQGRLKTITMPWADGPAGSGRVFLRLDGCAEGGMGGECAPTPAAPPAVTELGMIKHEATKATIQFRHSSDTGMPVQGYEIRILHGTTVATEQNFLEGAPLATVDPAAPGTMATFELNELKPLTEYVVAVRTLGRCGTRSTLAQARFNTMDQEFVQLTGCFIATAAYGSSLDPAVQRLRGLRDRARANNGVFAAAIDLYERSSPPLADLLRGSRGGRAVVRELLGPLVAPAK